MNQLSLTLEPPAVQLAAARLMGAAAGELAADRAEREAPDFRGRARAAVLAYLDEHVQASGEDITDALKAQGICPPDDRAFGPVFASLARAGLIVPVGYAPRRKGHGTGGARLWRRAGR